MQKVMKYLVCLAFCIEIEVIAPGFWKFAWEFAWYSDFGGLIKIVALALGLIWAAAEACTAAEIFCRKRYNNTRLSYRKRELYRKLGAFIAGDEFL